MTFYLPKGTSDPQDFQLRDDGVQLVGTGLSVAIEVYQAGVLVTGTNAPTVGWLDQPAGTVRVSNTDKLDAGTYAVRFKLTDGSNFVGYVPNGDKADRWIVVAPSNLT